MLSVRVPQGLEDRLDRLVNTTNRSRSYFVKKALERYLEDEEDYTEAVAAYEKHLRSGGQVYTGDDIRKLHGLG